MEKINKGEGFVIRVQGAVVDVRFNNETPEVYEALNITMKNGSKLVLETMFQMDNFEVRTIALGSTDGLKRGDKVLRTNAPISVPVGEKTLGRI
ncbi:MAG: F0F1 ATP synthase subunit beta, partial [Elusimicrobia bacterium]|nr:F0F1 ATP synthase subunit beta [Elusimicrobiota bacterium]